MLVEVMISILLMGLVAMVGFYLAPIGLTSKLTALAGIRMQRFEKMRWTFAEHDRECKECAGGRRPKCLVIAYAGGALELMRVPGKEFMKTLAPLHCDQLFLVDPDQSWYLKGPDGDWRGHECLDERLAQLCIGYDKVMGVGNCLGASAALLFARHAHASLAFNPHVNFMTEQRAKLKYGSMRLRRGLRESHHLLLRDSIAESKGPVYVHVGGLEADRSQARELLTESTRRNLAITEHNWLANNAVSLPGQMKKRDALFPLVHNVYQEMCCTHKQ